MGVRHRSCAKSFGLIEEAPQEIQLQVSADVAHFFQESQWHSSQQITPQKDGSLLVTFKAGGVQEIAWWVLSWGKEVKVLGPAGTGRTDQRTTHEDHAALYLSLVPNHRI